MEERQVILKEGKDKPIRNKHHWIFSGAISYLPEMTPGECLPVCDSKEKFLGWGYFNPKAKITGRMLSFDDTSPKEALKNSMLKAIEMRQMFFSSEKTNAYRLINGEGDFLPGLIVDRYNDILVVQISTLGMKNLRSDIVDNLSKILNPASIYEKSLLPSRKEEGLFDEEGLLYGKPIPLEIQIEENGLIFLVSILQGQKTGFFLDHREMRQQVESLAKGRSVLNCFSYTGGFSIYASRGGALRVDSVDMSASAISIARDNILLNTHSCPHRFFTADVFQFLREDALQYDLVILDPPAFAKRQKDVIAACRGYKDINRITMQKILKNSYLLTSSCSYHVDEALFQKVVFQAAVEAGRRVRIIGRHRIAIDHPINICHPESDYLKSLLLFIE